MVYSRPYNQQPAELDQGPRSALLHGACSLGVEAHQTELEHGSIAMTCSLEGTTFGKGSYWEPASLRAASMTDVIALL